MASNWLDKGLRAMEVIFLSPSPPDGWSQELVMMMMMMMMRTTTTTMTTTMIMIMIKVIMMMIKLPVVVMMMMTMMMINDDVMLCVEFLSVYKQGADACHLSEQGTWFLCG